ncbi:MerR family transcriptional regulator [Nocardia wallacei]|uniref:helix-turn-helix domain-containing protein n=1 Tax=Nocardia wallacei TaxID=480035 RepID=UPI002454EC27|nr:MerR family transcriptional regulator [Nocardia wallacei]
MNEPTESFGIATVAERFALPISTLHYWERQGLLVPHRRAGRRYYSHDQVSRIALIKLWRATGQLPLADIAALLHGGTGPQWRETVAARMSAIRAEMATLATAHDYLSGLLECHQPGDPTQCPAFRAAVTDREECGTDDTAGGEPDRAEA